MDLNNNEKPMVLISWDVFKELMDRKEAYDSEIEHFREQHQKSKFIFEHFNKRYPDEMTVVIKTYYGKERTK